MEAMEKGNMVPKNSFEVISLYVPYGVREILVFSATFDRQFLESLKIPGKPLKHGFNITEFRICVTKDGKDTANVISHDRCVLLYGDFEGHGRTTMHLEGSQQTQGFQGGWEEKEKAQAG